MASLTYATTSPKITDRDAMEDFERREVALLGNTKRVYVAGKGPAVIVMAEMPGIYAHVVHFARRESAPARPGSRTARASRP